MPEQLGLGLTGQTWPRLSEELRYPPELNRCQACGYEQGLMAWEDVEERGAGAIDRHVDGRPVCVLERWQEHDEDDQPEGRVIILCRRCSGRIIEPHPRLYRQLDGAEPFPGAHALCVGCEHRITEGGIGCRAARMNGGEGLSLRGITRSTMHVCRRPRSKSGWVEFWSGQAESCTKRKKTRA